MMELETANKDQSYMKYSQKKYDTMLEELQKHKQEALKEVDHDM